MTKVAIHPHIIDIPGIKDLALAFKSYKESGILPDNFGRDVGYDHPDTPSSVKDNLWHIHLAPADKPFDQELQQYSRTNRLGAPQDDRVLVYSKGYMNENYYILMAILEPNAHILQRDHLNIMIPLAEKAYDDFRSRF